MKLADALIQALADHGVQQVFGIPGDFALPLFKALDESKRLPLFMLSHEPGVGFAADAAARIASAPSAAFVTYGAGALNMLNAVASAYAEQVPVVVVSGAPGTHEGRGMLKLHHQVKTLDSQMIIYREVTCDQARLDERACCRAASRSHDQSISSFRATWWMLRASPSLCCPPLSSPSTPSAIASMKCSSASRVLARR